MLHLQFIQTYTNFFWNCALSIYFKLSENKINHRHRRLKEQTAHFLPRSENVSHNYRVIWAILWSKILQSKILQSEISQSEWFDSLTCAILRDMTAPSQSPRPVVKTSRLQARNPGLVGGGLHKRWHKRWPKLMIGIAVMEWESGSRIDSKLSIQVLLGVAWGFSICMFKTALCPHMSANMF